MFKIFSKINNQASKSGGALLTARAEEEKFIFCVPWCVFHNKSVKLSKLLILKHTIDPYPLTSVEIGIHEN